MTTTLFLAIGIIACGLATALVMGLIVGGNRKPECDE